MQKNNNIKITFCYPDLKPGASKELVIEDIIKEVKQDSDIGFAGFEKQSDFKDYLLERIPDGPNIGYKKLTKANYKGIEEVVNNTIEKCSIKLPSDSFFVFIFPWLGVEYDKDFGGINGFAPYPNTVHLFISPEKFSSTSLIETIAHELNHAVFLHYRDSSSWLTLLEALIFEGFAENFREEVVGGDIAPWSKALSDNESQKEFFKLEKYLGSTENKVYQDVFFGNKEYKKWTGYTIGYQIVKSFRKKNPNKSWLEILKTKPEKILEASTFIKK